MAVGVFVCMTVCVGLVTAHTNNIKGPTGISVEQLQAAGAGNDDDVLEAVLPSVREMLDLLAERHDDLLRELLSPPVIEALFSNEHLVRRFKNNHVAAEVFHLTTLGTELIDPGFEKMITACMNEFPQFRTYVVLGVFMPMLVVTAFGLLYSILMLVLCLPVGLELNGPGKSASHNDAKKSSTSNRQRHKSVENTETQTTTTYNPQ